MSDARDDEKTGTRREVTSLTRAAAHDVRGRSNTLALVVALLEDHADPLVQQLSIATPPDRFHEQPLAGQERKLALEVPSDRARLDLEPARDVVIEDEEGVHGQEQLGKGDPLVRRVVERPLEPLGRGGEIEIAGELDRQPRQPGHPLGPHGIPLVWHRGGADLPGRERLQDLPRVLEEAQVVAELGRRHRHSPQRRRPRRVHLARVGLAGHRERPIGVDFGEDNLLLEVGIDNAVSFTKGCYLGQEVVERIRSRGHVNRKLCGLLIDGAQAVDPGDIVQMESREVGRITSSVISPRLQRPIALGYLHRDFCAPDTAVAIGRSLRHATVAALPFLQSS